MKNYKAEVWVHPLQGDDRNYGLTIRNCTDEEDAKDAILQFLKKKGSQILTDYSLEEMFVN